LRNVLGVAETSSVHILSEIVRHETLPERVFNALSDRFAARAADIGLFTAAKYSFEEWLNWEAYAACAIVPGWQTHAKPRYCDLGAAGCKDFGDLLVMDGQNSLLVEIGLVHDETGNKWREKIGWDVEKLARRLDGVASLHLVALVSGSCIEASANWQRWLSKVPCWSRPNPLKAITRLPPNGEMVLQGWIGQCGG
jgi:hypothetical protein